MNMLVNILHSSIRMTAPLLLAAMGGLFTHQANVLNIALDGIMLTGAFIGVVTSLLTGNVYLAIIMAVLSGLLVGLLFSYFSITRKGNFIIIGLAVNIFTAGITAYVLRTVFGKRGVLASDKIIGLKKLNFKFLESIPILGDILNNHTPLVYFSLISVLLVHIILYKTIYGLRLRSVGGKS